MIGIGDKEAALPINFLGKAHQSIVAEYKEFNGNVAFVDAEVLWRDKVVARNG